MIRFFLFLLLVYFVWKIIQVVSRAMSTTGANRQSGPESQPTPKKKETFTDVRDAEFEELPPDDKKQSS